MVETRKEKSKISGESDRLVSKESIPVEEKAREMVREFKYSRREG